MRARQKGARARRGLAPSLAPSTCAAWPLASSRKTACRGSYPRWAPSISLSLFLSFSLYIYIYIFLLLFFSSTRFSLSLSSLSLMPHVLFASFYPHRNHNHPAHYCPAAGVRRDVREGILPKQEAKGKGRGLVAMSRPSIFSQRANHIIPTYTPPLFFLHPAPGVRVCAVPRLVRGEGAGWAGAAAGV